jgi:L-arabinose isomerase
MIEMKNLEAWFITGTQHLYGEDTLKQVADDSKEIAIYLDS